MCTRYSLVADASALHERFNVVVPERHKLLYNAAPADLLPVITHDNPEGISFFYWGIPPEWAQKKAVSSKLINAPVEQLTGKVSYKNALESRRCIIPADGFYAWKALGKKTRIPYRFVRYDKTIFAFAGLWEEFESEEGGEIYHTFSIITVPANSKVLEVDERMPAILSKKNESLWLNPKALTDDLIRTLIPLPADVLTSYTVSNRITTSGENSPNLIRPSAPVDQHGNYSLFD